MSMSYNNVLGNYLPSDEKLTDDEDDDGGGGRYEDSGSEPEPQMGIPNSDRTNPPQIKQQSQSILSREKTDRNEREKQYKDDDHDNQDLMRPKFNQKSLPSQVTKGNRQEQKPISKDQQNEDKKYFIVGDFQLHNLIDCEENILCCKYSPIEDVFAVGLSNGLIKIYSKQGQFQYVLLDNDIKSRRLPVSSIRFHANDENMNSDHSKMLAASYCSGYVKIWHYPTRQCVLTFYEKDRQSLALDFSINQNFLFVAGSDCSINAYDLTTKKFLSEYKCSLNGDEMNGHKSRIHAIRCHRKYSSIFLTGGWDNSIHYWDQRIEHSQKHFSGPHLCGPDSLDLIEENQIILTGSWRKSSTLQIWDFSTGQLVKDVFESNSPSMLYVTKSSSRSSILCGGNDKNEAILYDYSILKMIGGITNLSNAVYCADSDRHQLNLIVGSGKNLFIVHEKSSSK